MLHRSPLPWAIRYMTSLKSKINTSAALIVASTLVIFGLVDYFRARAQLTQELNQQSTQISARLQTSLPKPLWDFSVETAKAFVIAELANPNVTAVMVNDANGQLVFGLRSDGNDQTSDVRQIADGDLIKQEVALTLEENNQKNNVGKAIVFINDDAVKAQLRNKIITVVIQGVVLLVILQIAIGMTIAKLVTTPIAAILARIKDIAEGEGDLTKRVDFHSSDELGQLANAMNQFIDNIRRIIVELVQVASHLQATEKMTGRAFHDLQSPLQKQEAELTSLVAALNQMTVTCQHVAQSASQASHKVSETKREANNGLARVNDATDSTQKLADEVARATDVIAELEKHTGNIGAILDVIRNIADQTNLLALNAAIEAARAGEQGRGFAVVADEVRVLARRTQESTGEIQTMIEQLQNKTKSAVNAMHDGSERAETSVSTANAAGASFNAINDSISHIADMNTQIAAATEQQTATMQEIDRNVVGIHTAHERTLEAAESTARSEKQLHEVVEALNALVGQFKI